MTRTFIIKNTLKLSKKFLKDLYKIRENIEYFESEYIDDCESKEEKMKSFKDWLFNEDHYEFVGDWLNHRDVIELLKKHKINGEIIFDGEGFIYGQKYVDGILASKEIEISFKEKK